MSSLMFKVFDVNAWLTASKKSMHLMLSIKLTDVEKRVNCRLLTLYCKGSSLANAGAPTAMSVYPSRLISKAATEEPNFDFA